MSTVDVIHEPAPGELVAAVHDRLVARDDLRGFGGMHGGFVLAQVTAAMAAEVGARDLRGVTGRFLRPVRHDADIDTEVIRRGSRVTFARASISGQADSGDAVLLVEASATFGLPSAAPDHAPDAPSAPPPEDCPRFTIPPEFVPFSVHTEIRPVGDARPYAGLDKPELLAWIRLVEEDGPPDFLRLIMLADSLAPAHSAVMSVPTMIPTIELSIRPGPALGRSDSPWVLLQTRTRAAAAGWIDEAIDIFDTDGGHIAGATQLRVAV